MPSLHNDLPNLALAASGLTKIYGSTVALWQVGLAARAGDLISVTGPKASGKSTLLRIIAGLVTPTVGTVDWNCGLGDRRPRTAFVGHTTHLYDALTPRENIELAARLGGRDRGIGMAALDRLGLGDRSGGASGTLSAGTVRRVALARALATDPDVLVVDEPFASLDVAAADRTATVLDEERRRGRLIVVASHDERRIAELATRRLELERGRVRSAGFTFGVAGR